MRSSVQDTMLQSLAGILRPIVRLMLHCGLGCAEFVAVTKSVFVQVASEEFGIRGRPTNISRVAAMTGLSRKQVSRIRSDGKGERWSPDMESSPVNTVLHYWHYDPDFSDGPGHPKVLPVEGSRSFSSLVKRYAGDIPPGALKTELCRSGVVTESEGGLSLLKRYHFPSNFHDDYIRYMAFSLRNLGNTVAHNADLARLDRVSEEIHRLHGRFERCAWSEHLSAESIRALQLWVRDKGGEFIEDADHWIGKHEMPRSSWAGSSPRAAGVGLYFFIED
jgi:hypothetical protein